MLAIFVLWAIGATYFAFCPPRSVSERHKVVDPLECQSLKTWYLWYNDEYFGGTLPKNAVVDYGNARGAMAVTTSVEGVFHITLEKRYTLAANVAHENILHESCHVLTWTEFDEHGKRWYDCMHRLYEKGAFENLL